ncbi:gliding motility-associated-like protein [Flavobacterium sp. 1]|uniref:T9SS type B sorting domain-containing protein n=1 Tax=Flavobacterium sp. 1 TaxID=2035200 RepID=UPI000CB6B591|nr:gliding motility-associated C-terminal domain-containing protein [Flavobacterium sp. 1]PJJ10110.1 gliding motility-associated-like protein [Flavobacterium sp. 1]
MNRKPTFLFSSCTFLFFLMLLVLPSTLGLFAQTITPQKLPFDKICAGGPHPTDPNQVFNEYQAQFKILDFDPSATFVVELSDPTGLFVTPTATIPLGPLTDTPPDTSTEKTLRFAIPTDIVGSDKYQLRVKCTTTGQTSGSFTIFGTPSTKSFPAYFKSYNKSFFINEKKPLVSFCSGNSVTLAVYNPTPSDANSSPANFPKLKYYWYKDDVLIAGESSSSLVINTPGVYYAKLNYGPCTEDSFSSQTVTATSFSGSGGGAIITSSLGNPFCPGSENTTLTAPAGNSYIWRKDGNVISGATAQTYLTNVPGTYTCNVDFGSCSATATIDLKNTATISSNGNIVAEDVTLPFEQGNTLTVTSTTNVSNPTYQWYFNNSPVASATQSALDITLAGNYKVIISGCAFSFKVKYSTVINYNVPKIPNIITPNNDGTNDSWIIPDIYSNTNTHVTILSSLGEIVFETDNYDNYNGWPQSNIEFKNFNPIYYYIIAPNGESAKKGSITLLK